MTDNKEVMALNIKYYMSVLNVNATELCKALDIKQNTFSDWVHAKTYPRIDKIEKMANYFGVPKSFLVEAMPRQPLMEPAKMPEFIKEQEQEHLKQIAAAKKELEEARENLVSFPRANYDLFVKLNERALRLSREDLLKLTKIAQAMADDEE